MAYKTKADTRYSLVPTDQRTIIRCIIGSCLAVAAFFGLIHAVAFVTRVML